MSEHEEIGEAVDRAVVEAVTAELLEMRARAEELERLVEALAGEWEDDDAS
jgi:hypothetical protein